MHVLFVTPEYTFAKTPNGGLGNYVRKTAIGLAKRRQTVSIVVQSSRNKIWTDSKVRVYEIRCISPYRFINSNSLIRQSIRVATVIYNAYLTRRIVRKIHTRDPVDVIQTSNYLSPGIFLSDLKVPLICRVSSYAPLLHSAFGLKRSFGDYVIDYLELLQINKSNEVFSPSRFMAEVYKRFENLCIDVVPTTIEDISKIRMNTSVVKLIYSKLNSRKYFLYFGSLSRIKGADLLIDVIPKLLKNFPNMGFVIVGRDYGLPNKCSIIKEILSKCPSDCRDRLFIFPEQSKEKLYPVVRDAYAVIAPSRVDNYPNNCLEAQMFGVPIVGTRNSSIEEIVIDGQTGFLAENGSANSLFLTTKKIVDLPEVSYGKMKKKIRESISRIKKEDRIGKLISYYETKKENPTSDIS